MAVRGRKPKATALHLVEGTANVTKHKARAGEPESSGSPFLPKKLRKKEQDLWDRYIVSAYWLKLHDSPKALMWVYLQAEFEKDPGGMVASRIGQLRALGSELGLDPASRARLGGDDSGEEKDPYFDD